MRFGHSLTRPFAMLALVCIISVLVPGVPGLPVLSPATAAAAPTTIITVNTTEDAATSFNFSKHTCGWADGALFFPAGDNKCTLRRAVLEAANLPDSARPVLIQFDIPTSDPNYDASLQMWEVQIDETYEWDLDRRFVTVSGGQVTIDGSTQPGGRSSGPKIMVNTNRDNLATGGRSLLANTDDNVITDIGFHGGGQIILSGDDNVITDIWMGLANGGIQMQLASDASSQAERAMARGGIVLRNSAERNRIENNTIVGAFQRAIVVDGDDNEILGNRIGLNANGELGDTLRCTRDSDYLDTEWYGGDGILVIGSDNTLEGNVLGGLHRTGTATESPAKAFEIDGTDNVVRSNKIGFETDGTEVGICGGGMQLAGDGTVVTLNEFFNARIGSDNGLTTLWNSAIVTQSLSGSSSSTQAHLEVHSNVIDDGGLASSTFRAYELPGEAIQTNARLFPPAHITSIAGRTVTGTNGLTDPVNMVDGDCSLCTIYLYSDDLDDNIEAHELVGQATADSDGDWVATLTRELADGEGLRTQSQANSVGIIGTYGAKMTSRIGEDLATPSPPSSGLVPVTPCAVFDTRASGSRAQGQQTLTAQITGSVSQSGESCAAAGVVPANATGVMVNVVAVGPTAGGNLRISAAGTTANGGIVNFGPGTNGPGTNSNAVPVGLSNTGAVDVFVNAQAGLAATHVRLVVLGYYINPTASTNALGFVPVTPCAIFDTRASGGPAPGQATGRIQITGSVSQSGEPCAAAGVVPANAAAVMVNVVAVAPVRNGNLRISAAGTTARGGIVNFGPGTAGAGTNSNAVPVGLSDTGAVDVFVNSQAGLAATHVRLVVLGYYIDL